MKNISSIDCVGVRLQSAVTYTYIGSMAYLIESDTTKYFLKKLNLKYFSESICYGKTGYSVLSNQMVQFLRLRLLT
jgi:hypothetical protein